MKSFLDTSVLVAAFYGDHQHHDRSIALLSHQNPSTGATAAHCLAEVYSVVTGMPGKDRASADEALLFLNDVRERLKLFTLNEQTYWSTLEKSVTQKITGGAVYDNLIAQTALGADSESIYTWNVKHFARLGPEVAVRVRTPP